MIPPGVELRIVGDVHGDVRAFRAAVATDRFIVQLGDLSDHGPDSAGVLRVVMGMAASGAALCVPGNHDEKLARALDGKAVRAMHGLDGTLARVRMVYAERARVMAESLQRELGDAIGFTAPQGGMFFWAYLNGGRDAARRRRRGRGRRRRPACGGRWSRR